MVTAGDMAAALERIAALEGSVNATKCTEEAPHVGTPGLTYTGRKYLCSLCGNQYVKSGSRPGELELVG